MSTENTAAEVAEDSNEQAGDVQVSETKPEQQPDAKFTQADVDRIVRERLAQQRKNEFGDYGDLRQKAETAKTLEERVGGLENELLAARTDALRARVAAEYGISTKKGDKGEPSDADLFLTGTDETTLIAQAQRLGAREVDRKKQGNVAPKEGDTKTTGDGDGIPREFVRGLFATTD